MLPQTWSIDRYWKIANRFSIYEVMSQNIRQISNFGIFWDPKFERSPVIEPGKFGGDRRFSNGGPKWGRKLHMTYPLRRKLVELGSIIWNFGPKKNSPPRPSIFQILILEGPSGDFWTQWVQISDNQPSEPKITPHFSLWRPFSKIIRQKIPPPDPIFTFFLKIIPLWSRLVEMCSIGFLGRWER